MVINDHYRFVFVHVPKTGGTSIQTVLRSLRGNNGSDIANTKHEAPTELFARLGAERSAELRGYRFFCVVRNPWDRFVSLFRYLHKLGKFPVPESFREFAAMADNGEEWVSKLHSIRPQIDFVGAAGQTVARYETLMEDFAKIASALGFSAELPHLNSSGDRDYYREYYDQRCAQIVERKYKSDIDAFGYRF
jgi:hypothetical protein